jgi:cathepsin B
MQPVVTGAAYEVKRTLAHLVDKEANIRADIESNGPVMTRVLLPLDFRTTYKAGTVFTEKVQKGEYISVSLVGFGTDSNGQKYWIAMPAFGSDFGNAGTFLVARGHNLNDVESFVFGVKATPAADEDVSASDSPLPTRHEGVKSLSPEEAEELINSDSALGRVKAAGHSFEIGKNRFFDGMSRAQARKLLGTFTMPPPTDVVVPQPAAPMGENALSGPQIPDSFDSRQVFSKCVHPILNQEQCGSCWSFGATESLSDRLCVGSSGDVDVVLSPQELLDCACMGCGGGWLVPAWQAMASTGIVPLDCIEYQGIDQKCPATNHTCSSGTSDFKPYRPMASSITTIPNEKLIQMAIMRNGPIEAAFKVDSSFMNYKSGVFDACGDIEGGHAIKVVGWGVTDDSDKTPYWIVANSWGTSWGQDGFFWIKRGEDLCGIESGAVSGLPDLKDLPQ